MRIFFVILLASLFMSFNVHADPLKDLSWVKPQVMSVINNKHNSEGECRLALINSR